MRLECALFDPPPGGVKLASGLQGVVVGTERLEPIPSPRVTALGDRDDVVHLGGQGVDPFSGTVTAEWLVGEDGTSEKQPALRAVQAGTAPLIGHACSASVVDFTPTSIRGRSAAGGFKAEADRHPPQV